MYIPTARPDSHSTITAADVYRVFLVDLDLVVAGL